MRHSFSPTDAKKKLDELIEKGRIDLYKPIQVAEVLYKMRFDPIINAHDQSTYKNQSLRWRDEVTQKLARKVSTSSAQYQHDIWQQISPKFLDVLRNENNSHNGAVERYIYLRYRQRQRVVASVTRLVRDARPSTFSISGLLSQFSSDKAIRKSRDKIFEIVAYCLFQSIISALSVTVTVSIIDNKSLRHQFSELVGILTGLDSDLSKRSFQACVFRSGVTNAADSGIDMWSNFGPAVQVKYVRLKLDAASDIASKIEGDQIIIVCHDADTNVLAAVVEQLDWARKVRGIVKEADIVSWTNKAFEPDNRDAVGAPFLNRLRDEFSAEFPSIDEFDRFFHEREYDRLNPPELWHAE